jgi:uncharacterized membrane protein
MIITVNTLRTLLFSSLPIIELRGAIPIALSSGMSPPEAFTAAYIGSLIPLPVIFAIYNVLSKWSRDNSFVQKSMEKLSIRALRKSKPVQRYQWVGLIFFVAMPLPGSGIWSGAILSCVLKMPLKKSILAIAIGNLIAGIIVLTISKGIFNLI